MGEVVAQRTQKAQHKKGHCCKLSLARGAFAVSLFLFCFALLFEAFVLSNLSSMSCAQTFSHLFDWSFSVQINTTAAVEDLDIMLEAH